MLHPRAKIQGVAIKLSAADKLALDRQEGAGPGQTAYTQIPVQVTTYDGATLDTYIYSKLVPPGPGGEVIEQPCSIRYRTILVDGATAAGLDPGYVEKLAALPVYSPTAETLAARESLPLPESLPVVTVAELALSKETPTPEPSDLWRTSVLGYVFELPRSQVPMNSHRGRDITARMSRQWRGLSLDTDDDFGRPPYRLPCHMDTPEEVEHVERWRDHYIAKAKIVGFLAEYKDEDESYG